MDLITEVIFSIVFWWPKNTDSNDIKGFLIDGSAAPTFATGFDWHSQGIILRPGRLGSIIEVKRIEGPIFSSKEERKSTRYSFARNGLISGVDAPTLRR
jgi:hypothetical protein